MEGGRVVAVPVERNCDRRRPGREWQMSIEGSEKKEESAPVNQAPSCNPAKEEPNHKSHLEKRLSRERLVQERSGGQIPLAEN